MTRLWLMPISPTHLLCDGTANVREDGVVSLDLASYGCRWLRIVRCGDRHIL